MTKWHAHVAHMATYTNMVGGPGPSPPLNPALVPHACLPTRPPRAREPSPAYAAWWLGVFSIKVYTG